MIKGNSLVRYGIAVLALAMFADPAIASVANPGGSGLQWETFMQQVARSISGPVAYGASIVIMCLGGYRWASSGELDNFGKGLIGTGLGLCVLLFANQLISSSLFSGAVIPDDLVISAADLVNGK